MDTLNELVILQVAYCFLSFDLLDVERNFAAGYSPVVLTGVYLVIALLLIIIDSIRGVRRKIKVWFAKRLFKRQRKDLQDKLERNHEARRKRMHQLR